MHRPAPIALHPGQHARERRDLQRLHGPAPRGVHTRGSGARVAKDLWARRLTALAIEVGPRRALASGVTSNARPALNALDPILTVVAAAAKEGPHKTVAFDRAGLAKIRAALEARKREPGLGEALTAMVAFAGYLDRDCRSPKAAQDLLAVAVTALPAIKARLAAARAANGSEEGELEEVRRIADFLGEKRRSKVAPPLERQRPRGTIELGRLYRPRTITGR